jgi:hypothetical protein
MTQLNYYYLILLFGLFGLTTAAAQYDIEGILAQTPIEIATYDTTKCDRCIYLQLAYGGTSFLNLPTLRLFDNESIAEVEMIYSAFARTQGFDQARLNRERLHNLLRVAPELFDEQVERWSVVRQTMCNSPETCDQLFHGFVVRLKPGVSMKTDRGLIAPVDKGLAKKKIYKPLLYRDTVIIRPTVNVVRQTKRDCEKTGRYLPINDEKRREGVRYDEAKIGLFWTRRAEKRCTTLITYRYDTTYRKIRLKVHPVTGKLIDASPYVGRQDSTINEALTRNWAAWKSEKSIMVQDVTGSMTDLLPQMLLWNESTAGEGIEHFVFFNDGDNKPNNKKVIGKTGGLYYITSESLESIQAKANYAAERGTGGDTAENDVEALLYGEQQCPDCKITILVADNYAPVKDISLVKNLKKPCRVVVCGGLDHPVHADYVTIAALTGGSIHTMTMDADLSESLKNKEPITLGDEQYVFNNGRYERVQQ